MGTSDLARQYKGPLESSLNHAPLILPTLNTTLRRSLDQWFDRSGITPNIVAELEDSALVKVLGQTGRGLFFVPSAIESRVCHIYDVVSLGRIDSITERFYALNVERRLKHPAVIEIVKSAKAELFR
jgi:LysR family transcriptional activator of nhaA